MAPLNGVAGAPLVGRPAKVYMVALDIATERCSLPGGLTQVGMLPNPSPVACVE